MPWLNVPHHKQSKVGWCLPACITMVAEYWGHTFSQVEIARWLGARGGGVPASRVQRLTEHGFDVAYCTGSLNDAEDWLNNGVPVILFLRTGELSYWEVDTPHAVVLIGIETETAYLQKEAKNRQISLDELVTEALTRVFVPSSEMPEIEAVVAEIRALPPDPSHIHPAKQSLAELLRNAP